MDIEPKDDKVNISQKLETIDYSHGSSAAINASTCWGEGGTPQTVDYNHGQGVGGGGQPGFIPPQGLYGGGFPAYPNYDGFSPGGGGGGGGMPYPGGGGGHPGAGFFPGMDAASIFAAYHEQAGQWDIIIVAESEVSINITSPCQIVSNVKCHALSLYKHINGLILYS